MYYLFGYQLKDIGEFQKKVNHRKPEYINREELGKLVRRRKVFSLGRMDEMPVHRLMHQRCGFIIPEIDPEQIREEDVEGVIVFATNHTRLRRLDGSMYPAKLSRSRVRIAVYDLIQPPKVA